MTTATEDLVREVERLVYHEALLLDEDRYSEWVDLLTDDVWYFLPMIEVVDGIEPDVETRGGHYFDETKQSLQQRIAWLTSPLTPIEHPPSLKRRLISNVEVDEVDAGLAVRSNFMLWQIRQRDADGTLFVGRRSDVWRRVDGNLRMAERRIALAHPVLPRALSVFF